MGSGSTEWSVESDSDLMVPLLPWGFVLSLFQRDLIKPLYRGSFPVLTETVLAAPPGFIQAEFFFPAGSQCSAVFAA